MENLDYDHCAFREVYVSNSAARASDSQKQDLELETGLSFMGSAEFLGSLPANATGASFGMTQMSPQYGALYKDNQLSEMTTLFDNFSGQEIGFTSISTNVDDADGVTADVFQSVSTDQETSSSYEGVSDLTFLTVNVFNASSENMTFGLEAFQIVNSLTRNSKNSSFENMFPDVLLSMTSMSSGSRGRNVGDDTSHLNSARDDLSSAYQSKLVDDDDQSQILTEMGTINVFATKHKIDHDFQSGHDESTQLYFNKQFTSGFVESIMNSKGDLVHVSYSEGIGDQGSILSFTGSGSWNTVKSFEISGNAEDLGESGNLSMNKMESYNFVHFNMFLGNDSSVGVHAIIDGIKRGTFDTTNQADYLEIGISSNGASVDYGSDLYISTWDGDDFVILKGAELSGLHNNTSGSDTTATVYMGDGNDTLDSSAVAVNTQIDLGAGNDIARLGSGDDVVDGGSGDDIIDGGGGNDSLYGGSGNDIFIYTQGANTFYDGGEGTDTLFLQNTSEDLSLIADLLNSTEILELENSTLFVESDFKGRDDNDLIIEGDATSEVNLEGTGYVLTGTSIIEGKSYNTYSADDSVIQIETDVSVVI